MWMSCIKVVQFVIDVETVYKEVYVRILWYQFEYVKIKFVLSSFLAKYF